jgi:hypothetical protein
VAWFSISRPRAHCDARGRAVGPDLGPPGNAGFGALVRAGLGARNEAGARQLPMRHTDPLVAVAMHLSCPRCGVSITPKPELLTIEHCPRSIGRKL